MNARKTFFPIVIIFMTNILWGQKVDTLKYYPKYYPDSSNTCFFSDACFQAGYCEPFATWFTPDSVNSNRLYNMYSIKELKISFSHIIDSVIISIHLGNEFPNINNLLYSQTISIDSNEVNEFFLEDGKNKFKKVSLENIDILRGISISENFWLLINEKVFSVVNSFQSGYDLGSNHSFYKSQPNALAWTISSCDWMIEAIVELDYETKIENIQKNKQNDQNFILYQNNPNPFNSNETLISYKLDKSGSVGIALFTLLGKEVLTINLGYKKMGLHSFPLKIYNLATGNYIYVLKMNNQFMDNKILTIIK